MTDPKPLYDVPMPPRFRDVPYEELPPGLQRRVLSAHPELEDTPVPAAQPLDEDASARLAEVPEGAAFPYSRGGGWYTLSDGSSAQGEEAANEAQAALNGE